MRYFPLLLTALLLVPAAAAAEDLEVRSITLVDGRTLTAQVLESTAGGMRLRTPQGLTLVPYADLAGIDDLEPSAYAEQGPLRIAIAPAIPSAEDLAAGVDGMMGRAVGVMPSTAVVDAAAWRAEAAADSDPLGACAADILCLQPYARSLGADLIVVPQLVGDRVTLLVAAAASGEAIGIATAALSSAEGELNVSASADNVVVALFTALSLEPEIDLSAAIAAAFPAAAAVAAADADPDPAPDAVAGAGTTSDGGAAEVADSGTTDSAASGTTAGTTAPAVGRVMDPRRARAIGLGLLPVPGLSSASLGDIPGFIVGLAGTIGASWIAVYITGRIARTADAFWPPAILIPWGISVLFNQVTGAVSWRRLHGRPVGETALRSTHPRLGASVAPLMDLDRKRAPTGATVMVMGTF